MNDKETRNDQSDPKGDAGFNPSVVPYVVSAELETTSITSATEDVPELEAVSLSKPIILKGRIN